MGGLFDEYEEKIEEKIKGKDSYQVLLAELNRLKQENADLKRDIEMGEERSRQTVATRKVRILNKLKNCVCGMTKSSSRRVSS